MENTKMTHDEATKNQSLEHALLYASLGWHVFPLHSPQPDRSCSCGKEDCNRVGKHPRISEWQNRATTDENIIREWWAEFPDANIGIQTGERSGIIVLDVDANRGGSKSLKMLERLCGKIPLDVTSRTGNGIHIYFAHNSTEISNKQDFLPGLDIRGDGGYVVAPPSLHENGKHYRWVDKHHPSDHELVPMPESLINFIHTPLKVSGIKEPFKEGTRNASLFRIGAALRGKGMEHGDILDRLLKTNALICDPPLSESEVKKIAKSASRYEPNAETAEKTEGTSQSQELIAMAQDIDLFRTPDKQCYAIITVNNRKEVLSIDSKNLRQYLAKLYYEAHNRPPNQQALKDAIGILAAKALYESEVKRVYTRTAMVGDTIYLNLCNEEREAVQITPAGWDVISNSPVHFIVPKTMQPLVRPEKGGKIDELKRLINVGSEDQWILIVAWLLKTFIPSGAFPILTIQGEQGSSKSTTAKILKALIDPATAPLRSPPRSSHDLFISAEKAWVLAYDNLSGMQPWLSDALCTLSTGGGYIVRELFTDSEEVVFDVMRPIIINGIEDLAIRNDLADRAVIMYLPAIPKGKRRQESLIWSEFDRVKPLILGALLDAVSTALKNFNNVIPSDLPRMADFAHWVIAAEPSLPWEKGKYLEAYERNRREALAACLEVDMLATLISNFVKWKKSWEGTATELLDALKEFDPDETSGNRNFPKAPNYLSNRLRRFAPSLRSEGIDVAEVKRHGKKVWKVQVAK